MEIKSACKRRSRGGYPLIINSVDTAKLAPALSAVCTNACNNSILPSISPTVGRACSNAILPTKYSPHLVADRGRPYAL